MPNELQQLKARVAHLEEELLYAHTVLFQTTEAGCFHESVLQYGSPEAILHEADGKLRLVLPLVGVAFYLINEATADLQLRHLQAPAPIATVLPNEFERLLEERLIAQALTSPQAIFRSTRDRDATLILHGIATRSRVRGLFLGMLQGSRSNLRQSAVALLRLALANLAHTLESFELYRFLHRHNRELQERNHELEMARARFSSTFELMPMGLALIRQEADKPPMVLALNAVARQYSHTPEAKCPALLEHIFPCILAEKGLFDAITEPKSFGPLTCTCHGKTCWLRGQIVPVWPEEFLLLFEDHTQHYHTEQALVAARRITRMLEANARDLTLAIDAHQNLAYVSPSARTLLGIDAAHLVGTPATRLFAPDLVEQLLLVDRTVPLTLETELTAHDGTAIPCELVVTPLQDDAGNWEHIMVVARDIRERRALEARLSHQTMHDGLTGLPKRELFLSFIHRAIQAKHRDPQRLPTVLLVDVRRLSSINATLGHGAGDALLLQVANRIQANVRAQDAVARVGATEFGVLLDTITEGRTAIRLQRRLQQALEAPAVVHGHEIRPETAWGMAMILHVQTSAEDSLRQAAIALAQSKQCPRSHLQVFRPSLRQAFEHRATLEHDLARALEASAAGTGPLAVHFQPIVLTPHFTLWGFEALARWHHPQHGSIPPAVFIPLAEETGLMEALGHFVLEQACFQAAVWNTLRPVHLSVNLSPQQLTAPNLVDRVRSVLQMTSLPPERLTLEITESTLMANPAMALNILSRLRNLGLGIAIDDFGTGYSSLAYLHQLPATTLKIDRTFITSIHHPHTQNVVRTILSLAFSLNLHVVAEGVEQSNQAMILSQFQTHALQGFLFARPLPADEAGRLLETTSFAPAGTNRS